ncbi:MAG: beta-hexosaminidase, partial [Sphingobacteriales bacterium]
MRLSRLITLLAFTTFSTCALQQANAQDARYPIIPYPTSLTPAAGVFNITAATRVSDAGGRFKNEVLQLNTLVKQGLGVALKPGSTGPAVIAFKYD